MTDNRTTELRKLLDKRGVEWADQFGPFPVTAYEGNGVTWIAKEYTAGKFSIETRPVTPEQAIAATLGRESPNFDDALSLLDEMNEQGRICYADYSQLHDVIAATLGSDDDYEAKMDALLCRLTNGKWSKSRAYDLDFMEQCINEEFEMLYAKELADAELGNGTLTAKQVREAIRKYAEDDSCYIFEVYGEMCGPIADELNARAERTCEPTEEYYCKCGQDLVLCDVGIGPNGGAIELDPPIFFNYCPNCGAKVVSE